MEIITIGLDLAKHVFQVHAIDADGKAIVRKAFRRSQLAPFFAALPPCLIGIEACGTAHYWARQLSEMGHEVRLMPPAYVKPYVKRGKNDANDAEAICEAVTRPTMRFVPIKSVEQQAALAMHRARALLVRQRTQLVNAIRGLLAEFGVEIASGVEQALKLAQRFVDGEAIDATAAASGVISLLSQQALDVQAKIGVLEREILIWHRGNETSLRLATAPGIGPIVASAIVASVGDPGQFSSGRQFAAWLGLTPRIASTGGKERLGRVTKMGDKYLRRLLFLGMMSIVRRAKQKPEAHPHAARLLARKPTRLAAVAMANKTARVIWAMMARSEDYRCDRDTICAA